MILHDVIFNPYRTEAIIFKKTPKIAISSLRSPNESCFIFLHFQQ
jgi:hypothetical protein